MKSQQLTPPTTATVIPSQLQRSKQPYPIVTTNQPTPQAYPSPVTSKEKDDTTATLLQLAGALQSPSSGSLFAPLKNTELFGSPSGLDYGLNFPLDGFTDLYRTEASVPAPETTTDFYLPEFHEYSRQHYEMASNPLRKRKPDEDEEQDETRAAEIRRQIHIQSEQKRRAQIKDGFEELRKHLPNCVNKKISKASILGKTVMYLQQLKQSHYQLAQEVERLQAENERLRQFQEQVLQKQALDKIYSIGL